MTIEEIVSALKADGADATAIITKEMEGLKPQDEFDRVFESLRKERNDHKGAREKLAKFNGLNADEIFTKLDRIEELEAAAGGIDTSKIEDMVNIRLKQHTGPLERELSLKNAEIDEYKTRIEIDEKKNTDRVITDSLRAAATKANVTPTAVDDIMIIGKLLFDVNESGQVVARDSVGITPGIAPDVWLIESKSTKTHWWPQSQGAGATGGQFGGGVDNPWSKERWNMTAQSAVYRENPDKASQLAKSAGSQVGSIHPPK
jgi:hypothetical protein